VREHKRGIVISGVCSTMLVYNNPDRALKVRSANLKPGSHYNRDFPFFGKDTTTYMKFVVCSCQLRLVQYLIKVSFHPQTSG